MLLTLRYVLENLLNHYPINQFRRYRRWVGGVWEKWLFYYYPGREYVWLWLDVSDKPNGYSPEGAVHFGGKEKYP